MGIKLRDLPKLKIKGKKASMHDYEGCTCTDECYTDPKRGARELVTCVIPQMMKEARKRGEEMITIEPIRSDVMYYTFVRLREKGMIVMHDNELAEMKKGMNKEDWGKFSLSVDTVDAEQLIEEDQKRRGVK